MRVYRMHREIIKSLAYIVKVIFLHYCMLSGNAFGSEYKCKYEKEKEEALAKSKDSVAYTQKHFIQINNEYPGGELSDDQFDILDNNDSKIVIDIYLGYENYEFFVGNMNIYKLIKELLQGSCNESANTTCGFHIIPEQTVNMRVLTNSGLEKEFTIFSIFEKEIFKDEDAEPRRIAIRIFNGALDDNNLRANSYIFETLVSEQMNEKRMKTWLDKFFGKTGKMDHPVNADSSAQNILSAMLQAAFKRSLRKSRVVLYSGHSRCGTGPSFSSNSYHRKTAPKYRKECTLSSGRSFTKTVHSSFLEQALNYKYTKQKKTGRKSRLRLFSMSSCKSSHYWKNLLESHMLEKGVRKFDCITTIRSPDCDDSAANILSFLEGVLTRSNPTRFMKLMNTGNSSMYQYY